MEKRGNHFKVWGLCMAIATAMALALGGFAILSVPERSDEGIASGEFSNDELARFVSPAVYTLERRVEGTVTIPPLLLDLERFSVSVAPRGRPLKLPFNVNIVRAGFAVNTHGYVLTDGSLAASSTWKRAAVESFVQVSLAKELARLGPKGAERLERERSPEEAYAFGARLLDAAAALSTFEISHDALSARPAVEEVSPGEPFSARFIEAESPPGSEMALVALADTGIPALRLSSETLFENGSEIFIPRAQNRASSDGEQGEVLRGRIGMATTSATGTSVFLIADISPANILPGASVLDRKGEVLGAVRVLSPSATTSPGMLVAVPAAAITEFLSERGVSNDEGVFSERTRAGTFLLRDRRCVRAIAAFRDAEAAALNPAFRAHLNPSVAACERMIESGNSVDSRWEEFLERLGPGGRARGLMALAAAVVVVLIIILLASIIRSYRLRKQDGQSGLDDPPFAS